MYGTNMIKNLETKFQSAALAELLADSACQLGLTESLETWRVVDLMLRSEKAAYDEQYKKRLAAFEVDIPAVTADTNASIDWLSTLLLVGGVGLAGVWICKKVFGATPQEQMMKAVGQGAGAAAAVPGLMSASRLSGSGGQSSSAQPQISINLDNSSRGSDSASIPVRKGA